MSNSIVNIGRKLTWDGDECMLCQVAKGIVCLINLRTGNRIADGILVSNPYGITDHELKKIIGDSEAIIIE